MERVRNTRATTYCKYGIASNQLEELTREKGKQRKWKLDSQPIERWTKMNKKMRDFIVEQHVDVEQRAGVLTKMRI